MIEMPPDLDHVPLSKRAAQAIDQAFPANENRNENSTASQAPGVNYA